MYFLDLRLVNHQSWIRIESKPSSIKSYKKILGHYAKYIYKFLFSLSHFYSFILDFEKLVYKLYSLKAYVFKSTLHGTPYELKVRRPLEIIPHV